MNNSNSTLQEIRLRLPAKYEEFNQALLRLFQRVVQPAGDGRYRFKSSNELFFPYVTIDILSLHGTPPAVTFLRTDKSEVTVGLEETPGFIKKNSKIYQHLSIDEVLCRLQRMGLEIVRIDHAGVNLPWPSGVHPRIKKLRNELSKDCLYHLFPTGEAWDFILPGSPEEIDARMPLNYHTIRKPKFELVSFDGCSTPLFQFDVACNGTSHEIVENFKEGIHDRNLNNVWVYLENPYEIDICLVLGADYEGDWSNYFEGCRIME